jgi:uncharacterized membrane protein
MIDFLISLFDLLFSLFDLLRIWRFIVVFVASAVSAFWLWKFRFIPYYPGFSSGLLLLIGIVLGVMWQVKYERRKKAR